MRRSSLNHRVRKQFAAAVREVVIKARYASRDDVIEVTRPPNADWKATITYEDNSVRCVESAGGNLEVVAT